MRSELCFAAMNEHSKDQGILCVTGGVDLITWKMMSRKGDVDNASGIAKSMWLDSPGLSVSESLFCSMGVGGCGGPSTVRTTLCWVGVVLLVTATLLLPK